ncbi:FAD-dependent oxidoreductase [Pseudomonas sp. N040]|uniref:FAD-dependent oxidoreductase n=1 Tax=Pseudomonas sp. N040 TaxID=2785325 RepID=UPI0018A26A1D|nr:FAD-dependent oxidoreductase [Pseudomonas sp. N040]MBF7729151.1 FAD-dependent oxidoreductase [Pseudomonas sp. N040]MBW7012791.1 FAD-dependent oxidoreductase [Pseudomonas sp. N040]
MSNGFPTHARVVIVGGGVIGTSIAYHLAQLGWTDVVLLERDQLTSGTTWHAAGLIASAGMSSETLLWSQQYSRQLYERLEAETGLATGFKRIGHLHLASNATRRETQRREVNFARLHGLDKFELSPAEIGQLFPLVETAGLVSGVYTPSDGRANPVDLTMSLARGARLQGVRIIEGVQVTDFMLKNQRVSGVQTNRGAITAEVVVLAAGMWSRQLGAKIGVSVPLQAAEHYYLLTEPLAGVHPDLPVVEDPDAYAYVREESGGLLFGLFEPQGASWCPQGIADDASFLHLPPDWERMTPHLEHAFKRFPVMNQAGIKSFFCGPESFTPDGAFLMGESPEVDGLYVASGLNSLGILSAGGMGRLLAEQIVHGNASQDMTGISLARTQRYESTRHFLAARIPHSLGYIFNHAGLPNFKHQSGRNVRRLALHERYAARGAYFVSLGGWEMPYWFAGDGQMPAVEYRYGRQPWFACAASEHRATRESVALFDKSFMGKFIVQGRDAERVLNRVSANSVSIPLGRNIYTQWLNRQGGIVADLTITRLGEQQFMLVTGDLLQRFTPSWLRQHTGADEQCTLTDVTSAYTLLSLQGPQSRELLQAISGADLSTASVPFRGSGEIELGYARVLLVRITYMGELGYELYIPTEYSHTVYDALLDGCAAQGVELVHGGLMALDSLRLEKGYRDFGVDIDNTDTPLEAGLGFVVDFAKGDFIGRDVLLAQKQGGPLKKRLLQFLLNDPQPLLLGQEPIRCDGRYVGYMRSGAYGHTLGAAVGLGVIELEEGITAELLRNRRFEVEVNDQLVEATASLAPLYDPQSERIRH